MNKPNFKKSSIFTSVGTLLLFVVFLTGAYFLLINEDRSEYPGNGIYDLTNYVPYSINSENVSSAIEVISQEFTTNTTEISVKNNGSEALNIYLYDKDNPSNDFIGQFQLEAGHKEKFSMLSAASTYQIGVESANKQYSITISD